jgi:hypothetical protein
MAAKRRFKGCSSDDLHIKKQARPNVDHDEKQAHLNPDQIQEQENQNLDQIQKQENLNLDHIQEQVHLDANPANKQTHLDAFEVNKQEHLCANNAQIKSESLGLVKPTNFHQKLKDNLGRSEVIFSQYELLRRICSFLSTTDLFSASLGNYKSNSS